MTLWQLVEHVSAAHGVPANFVRSSSRERRYAALRGMVAFVATQHGFSSVCIGRALGGRSHPAILSVLRRVKRARLCDPKLAAWLDRMVIETQGVINTQGKRNAWLPEDFRATRRVSEEVPAAAQTCTD